ncbi:MAG: endonuclease [Pirellulales bacterium]|nr:endonuclease [Pirellulales bacterium]
MRKLSAPTIYWASWATLFALASATLADTYDPPANYYNTATGTGATLKSQLHDVIDNHTTRSYDQIRADLQITDDATPDNASDHKIRLVYNGAILDISGFAGPPAGWDFGDSWNREHSWPQSRGVDTEAQPDGSDLHHVFPCNPTVNSTRSNLNFGGVFGAQGNGIVSDGGTKYYPGDAFAGMIARAQFYMAVRYDGSDSNTTDLELAAGNPADSGSTLGDLNRLIEYHFASSPDTYERRRNQVVYDQFQLNRNPFIDRPEFVWSVFVNQSNNSQISIAGTTVNSNGSSTRNVDLGRVFVDAAVPAAQNFTLNKTGNNGTYFEVTTSGEATSSLAGRFNAMRTNQTDSKSINVGLSTSTATAGLRSGGVAINNLDITTGGGTGHGANDANDTFNISLTVLDHATPSFASGSLLSTLSHDFGNITLGSGSPSFSFDVYNLLATAGFTANMDFDTVVPSGNSSAFTTNLSASAGALVLAGGSGHAFNASLVAATVGTFSASYTLNFSDENIAGALNKSITLMLSGTTRLAGDYNGDLVVDTADYIMWRGTLNESVTNYAGADGDGNGIVGANDYNIWRASFGATAPASGSGLASNSVPEPGIGFLTLVAALLVPRQGHWYRRND